MLMYISAFRALKQHFQSSKSGSGIISLRKNILSRVISTKSTFSSSSDSPQNLPIIVPTSNVPIHLFSSMKVDQPSIDQLISLAQSVIPVGFVASMPDVHLGKGVTIGSVFASDRYICPNAVGVDIGCGMTAIPINIHKDDLSLPQKLAIQRGIKQKVPTGFNSFKSPETGVQNVIDNISDEVKPTKWLEENILANEKTSLQLGKSSIHNRLH